jgi:hypothetical protein
VDVDVDVDVNVIVLAWSQPTYCVSPLTNT